MIIKPPTPIPNDDTYKVFLAGSIDMGNAPDWQKHVGEALDMDGVTVLSPRRDDWDSTWEQSIDNPQFYEQVTWELDALDASDLIVMHFSSTGPGPITLLELGLFAQSNKLIVHCEEGYWRKGNVDIVCARYNILKAESIDELVHLALASFIFNRRESA